MAERLDARIRSGGGGEPLITYYELSADERTELSAATFGNWVAKTANLLGALAIGEGDIVRLELCDHAPGHWVTSPQGPLLLPWAIPLHNGWPSLSA